MRKGTSPSDICSCVVQLRRFSETKTVQPFGENPCQAQAANSFTRYKPENLPGQPSLYAGEDGLGADPPRKKCRTKRPYPGRPVADIGWRLTSLTGTYGRAGEPWQRVSLDSCWSQGKSPQVTRAWSVSTAAVGVITFRDKRSWRDVQSLGICLLIFCNLPNRCLPISARDSPPTFRFRHSQHH